MNLCLFYPLKFLDVRLTRCHFPNKIYFFTSSLIVFQYLVLFLFVLSHSNKKILMINIFGGCICSVKSAKNNLLLSRFQLELSRFFLHSVWCDAVFWLWGKNNLDNTLIFHDVVEQCYTKARMFQFFSFLWTGWASFSRWRTIAYASLVLYIYIIILTVILFFLFLCLS